MNLLWSLRKNGFQESTIEGIAKNLKVLERNTNLDDPESVKLYIANLHRTSAYKKQLCFSYDKYVKFVGLSWNKPKYYSTSKLPYIATEETIDKIIGCASKRYVPIFTMLKSLGLRPIELHRLTLRDYNSENGTLSIPETKFGNPRMLKLNNKLIAIFNGYIAKYGFKFPDSTKMKRAWNYSRKKAFGIYCDPAIKQIRLYDLRHFFATTEYYKTKDILHVKYLLGHKKIETTLIYTHLIGFREDEYTVRVSSDIQEASVLIESGFEYITTFENKMLYRKRK